MSRLFLNLAISITLASAFGCAHSKECEEVFAIEPSGMGSIRLGMSESEVRKVSIRVQEEMREFEGIEFRVLLADLDQQSSRVEINTDEKGNAIALRTYSSCFVFDERYSVNSSFEDLLSAFPEGKLITSESGFELNFVALDIPIGFTFQSNQVIDGCDQDSSECRRSLLDKTVDSVFVLRKD